MTFPDQTPAPDAIRRILMADPARPFVVAQLGQSLDGRIATPTGESRWINGAMALDHLHAVRAAVDAVVVGVGTVIADDPQLNVRRVEIPQGAVQPARVVLDPKGRMPEGLRLNQPGSGGSVVQVTGPNVAAPSGDIAVRRQVVGLDSEGRFAPSDVVMALFDLGYRRLLVEGGAMTVSAFIDAGVVDRLHVLVAPLLLGAGKTGLALQPIDKVDEALRPPVSCSAFADGDVLFDCDLRGGVAPR